MKASTLPVFNPISRIFNIGIHEDYLAEMKRAVFIINFSAALTSFLIIFVGIILYLLTDSLALFIGTIVESLCFIGVIFMNRRGNHNSAAGVTLLLHCCFALYFGALLGDAMPIELITVFLLTFLIGGCYLVYRVKRLRVYGFTLSIVVFSLTLLNNYSKIIEPVYIKPEIFYTVKVCCSAGMVVLIGFITFSIITQNDAYKSLNLKMLQDMAKVNDAKSAFISEASHEIRTPLSAMLQIVQLLHEAKDEITNPEIVRDIERLNEAGLLTMEAIANTLDMTKIESGNYDSISMVSFKLEKCIASSIFLNKYSATKKSITINVFYESGIPEYIHSDPVFLKKILNNLLSNAVKFSAECTSIDLSIKTANKRVYISVANPSDISIHQLQENFQRYKSERNAAPGTGIGINIAMGLVQQLDGYLHAEANGTTVTFYLSFPLIIGQPVLVDEMPKPASITSFAGSGFKAVILEDDEMHQNILRKWCAKLGLQFTMASNGINGLSILKTEVPDVLLCDDNLPGMTGKQIIEAIKKTPELKNVHIIIISSDAFEATRAEYIKLGVSDFIVKPVHLKNLAALLQQQLEKKQRRFKNE